MTFEEVQAAMESWCKDCLMTTEEFIAYCKTGFFTPYDGVGDLHDGEKFVTEGFETDIFDFIGEKLETMTEEQFCKEYPYVAWYNK